MTATAARAGTAPATAAAPTALVVGGSVAGLATAWALAERGYRVRVLEHGAAPDGTPAGWERPPVPQNRHSHTLTSLGVRALRRHAPALLAAALDEGARLLDLTEAAPPGPRPARGTDHGTGTRPDRGSPAGDDDLVALAVRRTTFERVLHRAVSARPGVTVEHGRSVRALLVDPATAVVGGAVTADGERIGARLVVDASGRRAAARTWLTAAGLPPVPHRTAATGLRVLTRFYRLTGAGSPPGPPPGPLNRGNGAGGVWDHYAAVVHPAEDRTFAVSLGFLADDPATRTLLTPAAFTAVARLSPYVAPWLAPGVAEQITGLRTMVAPPNILHGQARGRGGHPVAGLFSVADAACVTDPLFGRGLSLALVHAFRLADLLRDGPGDGPHAGRALSEAAVRLSEELFVPWYEQGAQDSARRSAAWRRAVGADDVPAEVRAATARCAGKSRPHGAGARDGRARDSGGRGTLTKDGGGPDTEAPDAEALDAEALDAEPPSYGAGPGLPVDRPALPVIGAAAAADPEVWRGLTRVLMTLSTPAEVFDDPDFRARVSAALAGRNAGQAAWQAAGRATTEGTRSPGGPPPPPARPLPPTRGALLDAVAAATGGV